MKPVRAPRHRKRHELDPHTDEPRDALELIARLIVGGGYRLPVEGRSTAGVRMTTSDVAAALGLMRDPLARRIAIAVATRGGAADPSATRNGPLLQAGQLEAAKVAGLAYRRVVHAVRRLPHMPVDLTKGADRWRLRIVTFAAVNDLIWPERSRSWAEQAKAAKMRRAAYVALHKCATSALQEALNEARSEFRHRMFSSGTPHEREQNND